MESEYPGVKEFESETVFELRAESRVSLCFSTLNPVLFPPGSLPDRNIVEIFGPYGTGKTLLITNLIANCILDSDCGGCGCEAVFIDLDHHFSVIRLSEVLRKVFLIRDVDNVEERVENCLQRLRIFKCFGLNDFSRILYTLEMVLYQNQNIGILFIDSISSFYWHVRSLDHFPVVIRDENPVFTKIAGMISRISKEHQVSFVISCQALLQQPMSGSHFMGRLWQKLPTVRLVTGDLLVSNKRELKLEIRGSQSELLPDTEKNFEMTIQKDGIFIENVS
ncbi:DNA repair protein XRCC2-like [Paramacrobiotus metropolitanus]|uniref:DNA repair protein XRCC2-like n=1 Tax=Paramacrobiotus metropolitanus TaxID=2943436 RepID=UPI0024464E8F|nr:DNA repair protein XRCC2-like [Paramacrobiotus metropolitanus]